MLTLRPSDGVNLATDRDDCPACAPGALPGSDCPVCHGKGTVPHPTGRQHLSHTMLGDWLACGRKYQLKRLERLEPVARRPSLDMGKAFQHAIEHRDPAAGAALAYQQVPVANQYDEDTAQIEAATVAAAARYYLNRWEPETTEQREFEYLIRLRNPETGSYSRTFDLLGYADGVIDHGPYLELRENKLLGRLDDLTIKRLKLDRQISLACYALWRATGKPVRSVDYRIVKKPSIRQRKGETVTEFCERLAADYADPARHDFYGYSEPMFRDTADLLRVEAELWEWSRQIRESARVNFYPRNTLHCSDFGGCAFLPICTGDPDALALYQRRPVRQAPVPQEAPAA